MKEEKRSSKEEKGSSETSKAKGLVCWSCALVFLGFHNFNYANLSRSVYDLTFGQNKWALQDIYAPILNIYYGTYIVKYTQFWLFMASWLRYIYIYIYILWLNQSNRP